MTEAKRSSVWRAALFALWAFALASLAYEMWGENNAFGFSGIARVVATAGRPYLQEIEITPHSPAARAGLKTGDVLDVRPMSGSDRYLLYNQKFRGHRMRVYALRAGHLSGFTLTVAPMTVWDWIGAFGDAGAVWIILFAGLLAWRRPDSADARILSLVLMLMALATVLHPNDMVMEWPVLDSVKNALASLCALSQILLCVYMGRFARPASRVREVLFALTCVATVVLALSGWTSIAGAWTGILPLATIRSSSFTYAFGAATDVCVVLYGIATAVQSRGAERSRFLWAFVPLVILYVIGIIGGLIFALPNPGSLLLTVQHVTINAALFLMPLGLTYSVLSRRLLDIGFVLNRAAIFSGVSIIVVGMFVLAEWALSEWMRTASHETNIAVSAALALLLGLSIRFVHRKVEHVVDTVMFRRRREDEEAIRKMAREAAYITDKTTLHARVERVLLQHADASSVTVLLDDGNGRYGAIGDNDPALVSMRADHARVDLHTVETAIGGEWAYPMVARGRLIGALVLGPKRSQESYAPDEADAIAQLAHSFGTSLEFLYTARDPMNEILKKLDLVIEHLRLEGNPVG